MFSDSHSYGTGKSIVNRRLEADEGALFLVFCYCCRVFSGERCFADSQMSYGPAAERNRHKHRQEAWQGCVVRTGIVCVLTLPPHL